MCNEFNNDINKKLSKAVYEGNLTEVVALLSAGVNVNRKVKCTRDSLLHISRSVEMTKELLLRGAEVNARNMYGETPLHTAIVQGGRSLLLVRELLKHGADVNVKNYAGTTALINALIEPINLELVKLLLEYGGDINVRYRTLRWSGSYYTSPFREAVCNLVCAKLLIKMTLLRVSNKDYKKVIDLDPYKGYRNYRQLSSYLEGCICEVLQMKTDEIKPGLSLHEFVTNNVPCNNQLSVKLVKNDYSVRYPIYYDVIFDKMKPFIIRAYLLPIVRTMQFYTRLDVVNQDVTRKKIVLDYDCTYKITEYLPPDDLLNVVKAFKNFNKRSSNLEETSGSSDTKRARLEE